MVECVCRRGFEYSIVVPSVIRIVDEYGDFGQGVVEHMNVGEVCHSFVALVGGRVERSVGIIRDEREDFHVRYRDIVGPVIVSLLCCSYNYIDGI